jgi:DNA (cytosine-5)-methyltransferase 1
MVKCYAYYNEIDLKACAWLRQLIKNGLIMDGEVDERSIIDVQASDLVGFCRQHFFSGIGGWDYALKLAGWPQDKPVCTASLPCQPFSVAGAGKGKDDERHLLPHFIELVKQCNFRTIFGEQVPGAIKHGWLDDLCAEMERENYAVGSIILSAAGAGAPHIRQRLYWVANRVVYARSATSERNTGSFLGEETEISVKDRDINGDMRVGLADASEVDRMADSKQPSLHERCESGLQRGRTTNTEQTGLGGRMGNTEHNGRPTSEKSGSHAASVHDSEVRKDSTIEFAGASTPGTLSEWTDPDWLYCRDNKYSPIKPGIKPLASGLPKGVGYSGDPSEPINADDTQEARVMRLKGYGNAIVPQVASQFIQAFLTTQ